MQKKLQRSLDSKIFGVCGGLGEYFDIDPTIIRIIFLVALVTFGSGLLLYLILALVMPKP
jgi:phage shock protein PspC (stress-responsive transcriptional regulator)